MDSAAAARALRSAAILGRNDAALLAQNFEEVHPRLVGAGGAFSVQSKAELRHTVSLLQADRFGPSPNYTLLPLRNKPLHCWCRMGQGSKRLSQRRLFEMRCARTRLLALPFRHR